MRIFYLTMKSYPSSTADYLYVRKLCQALSKKIDTTLVVNTASPDLAGLQVCEVAPMLPNRTLSFIWWFLRYVRNDSAHCSDCTFMTNDFNIALVIIIMRRLFRAHYRIATDWHLMTDSFKDAFAMRGSDVIFATSQTLRAAMVKKVPDAAYKTNVVYGGVDYSAFDAIKNMDVPALKKSLGLPQQRTLYGYTGYFTVLDMEKGIDLMIEALKYLPNSYSMVCVGAKRGEKALYEERARVLGLSERCIFVDAQKHEKIPEYLHALDILVIPYPNLPHFRQYGFPMKVWEYLAAGKPIVYADLPVIAEVLKDKGIAFIPGDARSFAFAIERASTARSNIDYSSDYSWSARAENILSILTKQS
jgi:glycosyltransferase involved in cell wall biosynthesis